MKDNLKEANSTPAPAGTAAAAEVRPSERGAQMRYAIRDVLKVAQQAREAGKQLVPLNIGDPLLFDFRTPAHMIEATYQAMLSGHNGYAPSVGIPEAIEAVRAEAARQGIGNVQDVFLTSGVSEAVEVALAGLLNTGENVLIPSPGYPVYEVSLAKLGFDATHYYLDESNAWQPDLDDIARRINNKTRALVVINPNNPTGAVCRREALLGILGLAARHGLVIFCDEIYNKLLLDPVDYVSLASLAGELPVVTFNGLSKSHLVPGFRIGWAILSGGQRSLANYSEAIAKMLRARLSANHPAQFAVRPALEGDQGHIPAMIAKLKSRRDLTVALLNSLPNVHCFSPQAAFYAFPRLEIARSDAEFVTELVQETGVIVVPGTGFGQAPGTQHFRLVFLPPEDSLRDALDRIGEFARKWQ